MNRRCRELLIISGVLTVAVVCPGTLLALPIVPEQQGWGGFFAGGLGYTDIKSNTVAGNKIVDGGKDTINNIFQSPESSDNFHPVFTGEVNYTLANRNQIFLGTSLEDALTLDGSAQLGWRKQTERSGIFQVGILFSGIPPEVWEDPYLTGVPRSDTDRDTTGLRFQWDRIFGTALEWQVSYRDLDVDNDRSGQNVPGCLSACQSLLRRDGDWYDTELSWLFKLAGGKHILRPLIGYRSVDTDGDAESFDSGRLQLTYSYMSAKYIFVTNALAASRDYDEPNPLYGIKRDSDIVALGATLFYQLPTASKRWRLVTSVLWSEADSDIDFHDNELFTISVSAFYRFGNPPTPRRQSSLEGQPFPQPLAALR